MALYQLIKRLDTRFRLGLARLGAMPNPLKLFLNRLGTALIFRIFLLKPLGLAFQPRRVIPFKWNAAPAINFEHPTNNIIEEVTIVGDENDVTRIIDEMLLKPRDTLGIQMVGRLIKQQHFWLFKQQTTQRDTAALTA